jgi:hypothetical protein
VRTTTASAGPATAGGSRTLTVQHPRHHHHLAAQWNGGTLNAIVNGLWRKIDE